MKKCAKCGELNGGNANACFRCGASFPPAVGYKKICPRCGGIFDGRMDTCPDCPDVRLSVYTGDGEYSQARERPEIWMYIVGILIPLVGIILGCIYIARGEDDLGKSVLLVSIFVPLAVGLIFGGLALLF